jgi:16S rRNA (guanine1207-N2)-methyltransferase
MEHYYTARPTSQEKSKLLNLIIRERKIDLEVVSGVFGFRGRDIDRGTRLLAENMILSGERFLDLGCGCGVLGITAKILKPSMQVFISDINERAIFYAKRNGLRNRVEIDIRRGDLFEPWEGEYFDNIVSNPPLAAGMKICNDIITASFANLKYRRSREDPSPYREKSEQEKFLPIFQIVARHNKGGERLMKRMEEVFGNVETIVKSGGFRVYISYKHK